MEGEQLPVGFKFSPNDWEIARHYLINLMYGDERVVLLAMNEVPFYNFDPWDLPGKSKYQLGHGEWFFLTRLERMNNNGTIKRKTSSGTWKVTGKPKEIKVTSPTGDEITAVKKRLVFLRGKNRDKTDWTAHEFQAQFGPTGMRNYVIYKLKNKAEMNDGVDDPDEFVNELLNLEGDSSGWTS